MSGSVWDYHTGEDYIRIEIVKGDEVIGLVAEIPLSGLDEDGVTQAEYAADALCRVYNGGN